jgi:hypothetical protein
MKPIIDKMKIIQNVGSAIKPNILLPDVAGALTTVLDCNKIIPDNYSLLIIVQYLNQEK